jgi:hypothetical protein
VPPGHRLNAGAEFWRLNAIILLRLTNDFYLKECGACERLPQLQVAEKEQ